MYRVIWIPIKNRVRRHKISFKCAFEGLRYAFKTQPNFSVHLAFAIVVVIAAYIFKISQVEFLIILLLISLVFIAELVNTTLETTVDLITEAYHPKAKVAKDLMSAAVLVAAIASVVVGLIIFLPYLLEFLKQ